MGLADKVIKRLEQQADTIAQYRQLDEKRRSQICELERKLGDAERERDKLGADRDETEAKRKLLHEAMTRIVAELSEAAAKYWPDHDPSTIAIATFMGEIESLRAEIDTLRQQLDAARAEVVKLRTLNDALLEKDQRLRSDHARLGHLVEERGQELERLRAFVEVMRGLLTEEYADQRIIAEALAELDAGTSEPAPVAETLGAEGGA